MTCTSQTSQCVAIGLLLFCGFAASCKAPQEAVPTMADSATISPSAPSLSAIPAETASAQPEPVAQAPSGSAPTEVPEGTPPPPTAGEPLPPVKVKNIGMHIGGGPHDDVTKKPIADSVKPHFDALRVCWKHAEDQSKPVDFGVDLLIPREGGKAKVSHPRTAMKSEEFRSCVVGVFEAIEYLKPKTGTTMVSYSVRFTP